MYEEPTAEWKYCTSQGRHSEHTLQTCTLQISKSQNMSQGDEHAWKTVLHTWRTPADNEIHGEDPSSCLSGQKDETESKRKKDIRKYWIHWWNNYRQNEAKSNFLNHADSHTEMATLWHTEVTILSHTEMAIISHTEVTTLWHTEVITLSHTQVATLSHTIMTALFCV